MIGTRRGSKRAVAAPRARRRVDEAEPYELRLFIAGTTPHSAAALATVVAICQERLAGRHELVVIDVYQQPTRARDHQVIAVPTLLKTRPAPVRRLIGDLSDRAQVLRGLNLPADVSGEHEEA